MPETPKYAIPYPATTERPSATQLQSLAEGVEDALSPVWGSLARSAVQSLVNGTETPIVFTADNVAAALLGGGMTADAAGLTVPVAGVYSVTVMASFAASAATGSRIVVIRVAGASRASFAVPVVHATGSSLSAAPSPPTGFPLTRHLVLAAGERVTCNLYQSSGQAINTHTQAQAGIQVVRV